MTARAIIEHALPVDPVIVFRLRCEAQAQLYSAGQVDLHDAVDVLQDAAAPLVVTLGPDAAQAIMADAFRLRPERERSGENSPSEAENTSDSDIREFSSGAFAPAEPTTRDAFLEAYRRDWEATRADSTADCSLPACRAIVEKLTRRQGTPQSIIDAMLHSLRRGLSCLANKECLDRLRRCDEAAIRTIAAALLTWPGQTDDGKPRPWLPAWRREDVAKLIKAWRAVRGGK
jgi:hypothetical protein